MTNSRLFIEKPKLLRSLPGEVHGTVLIGFIEACTNLHLLTPGEPRELIGDIEPTGWYPLERVRELERMVDSKFENASIILERAGIEFIKKWVKEVGEREAIRSGIDFLLLQCDSRGFGNVFRGGNHEIGRFELIHLDLIQGRAAIVSNTPFSRSFEKGVITGGMLALGDLWYVKVDNGADPNRFEIDFKPCHPDTFMLGLAEIPSIREWDGRADHRRELVDCLYWRYQGLIEERRRDRAFWHETNTMLERLATELREVSRQMKDLAHRDSLTSLLNRRGILLALTQEFSRSVRYEQPLSLAILDFDWFKQVNDNHGHMMGDEVLYRGVTLLAGLLRSSDTIGRLSGEEFLVIFPGTTIGETLLAADKLRLSLEQLEFAGKDGPFHVTASFGVAGRTDGIDNPMEILRRADCALYQAKAAGRNRVERFSLIDRLADQ